MNFEIPPSNNITIISRICGFGTTILKYCLNSKAFANLATLSNRYLVIDSPLVSKVIDMYCSSNYYTTPVGATLPISSLKPIVNVYNLGTNVNVASGTIFAAAFFFGAEFYATTSNRMFDLKFTASIPTPSTYQVAMTSGITT